MSNDKELTKECINEVMNDCNIYSYSQKFLMAKLTKKK